jgi:flagellar hook-basal body complex protein FliE
MPINGVLGGIQTPPLLPTGPTQKPAAGPGFGGALAKMVASVEQTNDTANDAVGKMLDGSGDVHEAMIAIQRADLTFQYSVQVRNKLVQAYQDIMRMPV